MVEILKNYILDSISVFYFNNLVVWVFDHLNVTMLALVVLNVMPMTD